MTEEDISAKAKAIRELAKSIIDTIPEGFDSRDAMGSMEKVWEAYK